ncbi:MAG: dihydropteroate synthase [Pigmentiphaga sp.]
MSMRFICRRFELDLAVPRIMGIVNVTPDSFSDGGRHANSEAAIAHARQLIAEGADILDIGGESTRPGASEVSVADEITRVVPVLEGLRDAGVPLSVDTCKPEVMAAALDAGADIVNDIRGFDSAAARATVHRYPGCGLVVMHMQGEPRTMQEAPHYVDVVGEVEAWLLARAAALRTDGHAAGQILLDPGLGFGKTLAHNLALAHATGRLASHGYGVLVGGSRKSMLGALIGRPAPERVSASVALALAVAARGAGVVRVHDVAATADAFTVWQAIERPPLPE